MSKYNFTSKESGLPCSDKYNAEVSQMFFENPVLEEIFLIYPDLLIYLADKLSIEEIDWNSRLDIANLLNRCDIPEYRESARIVAEQLRNRSLKA